jgi:hypothetical protein
LTAPVRVAIFGSCVSRDLFEDPALRRTLAHYASRSSVISVVADPVPLSEEEVPLDSAYQRRAVVADFNKTFFPDLRALAPDWLVIDLIDERFNVLRTAGSFVTESSAFQGAGLARLERLSFSTVRRLTDEAERLFDAAAESFVERVTQIVPADRVILHRGLWLTRYRRGELFEDFPEPRLTYARRNNEVLGRQYDLLQGLLGGDIHVIGPELDRHVADYEHKWALEPFHYEEAYNAAAIAAIRELAGV